MALFKKKLSLEEILEGINALNEEEKAELEAKMKGGEEVEEVKTEEVDNEVEATEVAEKNGEETTEEEMVAEEPATETVEEVSAEAQSEELNAVEKENKEDVNVQLAERVSALEQELAELKELKEKMQEFTKKQAEKFGYEGALPSAKKDYGEMSASELSKELKSEI